MENYDVFNGDADGICALLQLHFSDLGDRADNHLLSGVKRDIQLLKNIQSTQTPGHITVLDISLDKNRDDLIRLLALGYKVLYADHHFAGEIPQHSNLTCLIDTDSNTCTSLIINQHLNHRHFLWAITGAYGDNLFDSAQQLATQQGVADADQELLKELGTLINYNGYGAKVEDLHFAPQLLFRSLLNYPNPLDFIEDSSSDFKTLQQGYQSDIAKANDSKFYYHNTCIAVILLPQASWSRRVSGVYGNALANQSPDRAHAILTPLQDESGFTVSVRAPLNNKSGADELCRQFPSGGGRKAAAGINNLAKQQLDTFIERFNRQYC